jgi:hypothetical protein
MCNAFYMQLHKKPLALFVTPPGAACCVGGEGNQLRVGP